MRKKLLILIIVLLFFSGGLIFYIYKNNYFFPPPAENEIFYKGNFHTHTLASDGQMAYDEAIDEAKKLGFNFIAITDHNTISYDVKNSCPTEKRIFCIIGEEVSSREGHILAIGIKDIIPKNLTPEETIQKIHEQGGLAIAAHPSAGNGLEIGRIKELPFDAVECSIRHQEEEDKYDCQSLPDFPHFYNSDAHNLPELSRAATKCLLPKLTFPNLETAIKNKQCFKF